MSSTKQLARHLRDVHFGGNWTAVNLKEMLEGVTWQQATTKIHNLNTIATLVYHINYYYSPALKVLQGQPLVASDKYSFDTPEIASDNDWQKLISKTMNDAEALTNQIELLNEAKLLDDFSDNKYGNYFRNLAGIVEHTHYHLGQISLIKKMLSEINADSNIM